MSRRTHKPDRGPVPIIPGVLLGAVSGLLYGTSMAGLGALSAWFFGLPAPTLWLWYASSAGVGLLLGTLVGAARNAGPSWLLAMGVLVSVWVVTASLAGAASAAGLPGVVGLLPIVGGLIIALVLGQVDTPPMLASAVGMLLLLVAAVLPEPLHLTPVLLSDVGALVAILLVALLIPVALPLSLAVGERTAVIPLALLSVVGAGCWLRPGPDALRSGERVGKDVVLIVASGLRSDRLGRKEGPEPSSPNIDRILREGVHYPDATAASSWTVPGLASVLTGIRPYTHRAGLSNGSGDAFTAMRPGAPSMGRSLNHAGYATAMITGDQRLLSRGVDQGFSHFRDTGPLGMLPPLLENLRVAGVAPLRVTPHSSEITDQALAWLAVADRTSLFVVVHYSALDALPFPSTPADVAAVGTSNRPWPEDAYDAGLHALDAEIGRLRDQLGPQTILALVSDHGIQLSGERTLSRSVPKGTRTGHSMHQEILAVPMVIVGAGQGRSEGAVSTMDLAPTLMGLVGVKPVKQLDGEPLPLRGRVTGRVVRSQGTAFGRELEAVRIGNDKLIVAGGEDWLYDLSDDPLELKPRPRDSEGDILARELREELPAPGAGWALEPPPPLGSRLGRVLAHGLGLDTAGAP